MHSIQDKSHKCPICEGPLASQVGRLDELVAALKQLEKEAERAGSVPAAFDREMLRVRQDIETSAEKLRGIALRKAEVSERSAEAKALGFRESEKSRFLGRVEKGLEMHKALGQDGDLAAEVSELRQRERALANIISKAGVAARLQRSLDKVALLTGRLLPGLDVERPNDPIELSVRDLMVKVKGPAREDFLWEIGSGANWLAYHVAVSLSLQQFFIESGPNPVPGFLVYDQPSQVYFPRKLAANHSRSGEAEPTLEDEDVEAVQKVFATLASVATQCAGQLQLLVLDHAGANVWGDVSAIHLIEEWRQGKKLIPPEWLA